MSFYCDICGRESKKKIRMGGYTLCAKHLQQLHTYGRFLDNNPRTKSDLNGYRICGDVVYFELYSARTSDKIAEFIIDREDLDKVKYHKWRLAHGHVYTGRTDNKTQRNLSWVILGLDNRAEENKSVVVDHINGDGLDNRKSNLRICTRAENNLNKRTSKVNTSGFIGISTINNGESYMSEIRKGDTRCCFGTYNDKKFAVYARYIAEELVFEEYTNKQEHLKKKEFTLDLPQDVKDELESQVKEKLKSKGLWQ